MLPFTSRAFFILLTLVFSLNQSKAGHVLGGEIYWECLNNGEYVFHAKVIRDCSGIQFTFQNQTLTIVGNPLPLSASNSIISAITLKPDSLTWLSRRNGNTSPNCAGGGSLSCLNGDPGTFEQFPFRSDTLTLKGTPPASGWKFWLTTIPCCRPSLTNLAGSGTMMVRAIMYPNLSSTSTNLCDDSSPKFSEIPDYLFCKRMKSYADFSATDGDLDSISYHFDRTYNIPPTNPQAVPFRTGYSLTNPTPNSSIDTNNIPARIDSVSGIMSFLDFNLSPQTRDYYLIVRADAWRGGQRIASVFREHPINVFDCPVLPNLNENDPPIIQPPFITGPSLSSFNDTVVAGSSILVNLSVRDTNRMGSNFQTLNVELWGDRMSKNLNVSTNCPDPNDTTCAFMISSPQFDTLRRRYYYTASASWNSIMSWQTNCYDLDSNNNAKTHIFYVRASDDFCPIPGKVIKTIRITVLPNPQTCPSLITALNETGSRINRLKFYPNPTNGLVFIDGVDQAFDYQIFNIQGKLMKRGRLAADENQLELPEAEGLYFVSFRDEDGNEKTYKLVKQ